MNISGIRTGAGFYDYNSIKINEVRSQQIQEARESEQIPVTGTVEQNDSTDAKVEQIPAAQKKENRTRRAEIPAARAPRAVFAP